MMKRTIAAVLILFAMVSAKPANANLLIDMLMDKLGVSELQAKAGTGILLNYLKSQVSSTDFEEVSDGVDDGAGYYMKAADDADVYKSSTKSMSNKFGKKVSANTPGLLGNAAEPFKNLGLNADMITKYSDLIVSYLKTKGKEKAASVFMKMLN